MRRRKDLGATCGCVDGVCERELVGCHGFLHGAENASFHLDGVQSKVSVCYGLERGLALGHKFDSWWITVCAW